MAMAEYGQLRKILNLQGNFTVSDPSSLRMALFSIVFENLISFFDSLSFLTLLLVNQTVLRGEDIFLAPICIQISISGKKITIYTLANKKNSPTHCCAPLCSLYLINLFHYTSLGLTSFITRFLFL